MQLGFQLTKQKIFYIFPEIQNDHVKNKQIDVKYEDYGTEVSITKFFKH